jgi:hypothetical protein
MRYIVAQTFAAMATGLATTKNAGIAGVFLVRHLRGRYTLLRFFVVLQVSSTPRDAGIYSMRFQCGSEV